MNNKVKDYFFRLIEAYNYIPTKGIRIPCEDSPYSFPIRDSLALIAERAIELEKKPEHPTFFQDKNVELVTLISLSGNKDKKQAIYDITKRIEALAYEAIQTRLDKYIQKSETENNEAEVKKFKELKKKAEEDHNRYETNRKPGNHLEYWIIGAPPAILPEWYNKLYSSGVRSWNMSHYPDFSPND